MEKPTITRIDSIEDYADKLKRLGSGSGKELFFTVEGSQQALEKGKFIRAFITFSTIHEATLYVNVSLLAEATCHDDDAIKKFNEVVKANGDKLKDYVKRECPSWKLISGTTNFVG